jgi:hypothetical protein
LSTGSGTGPDAVTGRTLYDIQIEQAEMDGSIQRRKPGAEIQRLPPGEVPLNPNNVWNTGDRAPEPPVGDG